MEGSLNNLKQSMVQFQKPKKVYNDRRVYPGGGGPALGPGEGFVPAATASAAAGAPANERRNGRARSVDGRNGNILPRTSSSCHFQIWIWQRVSKHHGLESLLGGENVGCYCCSLSAICEHY